MCTHPYAKKALTLHLARSEGHERYLGCNLMHRRVLASSHQHLMAEAPLCSIRTMYRILEEHGEVRERRNQRRHPNYTKPELLAEAPNQVWSWDITKLRGPVKWTYYYLYVILDIFSRYVVGWMLAHRESAALAQRLIAESCRKQDIEPDQLTLHADRGSSMRSKPVGLLLADLGVTKTHSRPYVSNDNPYSESQFKTMKYCPQFPSRFGSAEDGRLFCCGFFAYYNFHHRHSGIGLMTPADVHYGRAEQLTTARRQILLEAQQAHPERFVRGTPQPPVLPPQGRCCTALAESEIRLWWWPRYVSSMKYPKRCQYKHAKQKKYHVRNWAEYNEGLRRRGDLTVWFDEEAIANWKADKTGKPGGQRVYSDMAIETGLVVRMVYKLAYRQTEGFLHSIASLLGLGIEIPDYSTLCRRSRLLRKKLRIPKAASTQPIHLMIDSTGLRIHVGNARKPPKLRAWRKLHIAVDRETGNIVASELTASRARDATRVPALLTQIQAPLVSVAADSAYDKEAVYEAIEAHSPGRRTRVVIPPQRNATLSQNSNTAMQERDRHIRAIERHGRREWYKLSGYTKRSMVENAVYRYKAIIGPEMRARTLARQRVEHRIGCEILNKMAALGMPDTYCAG